MSTVNIGNHIVEAKNTIWGTEIVMYDKVRLWTYLGVLTATFASLVTGLGRD